MGEVIGKNVFIKSMLRQPVRSMLLLLLITAASFAFVVRSVEYIVVRNRIADISEFFTSVGFLSHRDGITADVSEAIEFLAENPYVSLHDRRRGFEGTLVGLHNACIHGSRYWHSSRYYSMLSPFEANIHADLMPRLRPIDGFAGFVSGDSFFFGEVIETRFYMFPAWWDWHGTPHKMVYVRVHHVLQGYPERLFVGQELRLRFDFPYGYEYTDSPLIDMKPGQLYLLRGTFYFQLGNLQRDTRFITKFARPLDDAELWYVPVTLGEEVDTAALGINHRLEFAHHVQSAVYLRTTRDMASLPYALEHRDIVSLTDGRFIDYDDYLNARQVVVVHRRFAQRRDIAVGDTITVAVNAEQHLVYSPYYVIGNIGDMDPHPVPITAFPELGILSVPGGGPTVMLELEVVGMFELLRWRPIGTDWSSLNKFMYIPDSLLPGDWGLQSAHFGDIGADYTPALFYSFVLHDSRDEAAFLWDVRDDLAAMGFGVRFVSRDGSGFWATANIILLSITINLVMFASVLVLVLAFAVALYMWQRSKEYAILRSLGCSVKNIFIQSTTALLLIGLPAVAGGSIAGWFFAVGLTQDTIAGFSEIVADAVGIRFPSTERDEMIAAYIETALPTSSWLIALGLIILALIIALIIIGNLWASRRSVLEMLKGVR